MYARAGYARVVYARFVEQVSSVPPTIIALAGWFDPEIVPAAWFSPEAKSIGWFDRDELALGNNFLVSALSTTSPISQALFQAGKLAMGDSSTTSALARQSNKFLLATASPTSAGTKQTTRTAFSTTAPIASLSQQTRKLLAATAGTIASLVEQIQHLVSALSTTSPVATDVRQTGKSALSQTSLLASLTRSTVEILLVATSPITTLAHALVKVCAATTAPIASLVTGAAHTLSTLANTSPSASLARRTGKVFNGVSTAAASLIWVLSRALTAITSPVASSAQIKVILRSALALAATAVTSFRQTGKLASGTTTPAAAVARTTNLPVLGSSSVIGTIFKGSAKVALTITNPVASFAEKGVRLISALTSTTPVATTQRFLVKTLLVTTTLLSSSIKTLSRSTGSIATAGASATKSVPKLNVVAVTAVAILQQTRGFSLRATSVVVAGVSRSAGKVLRAVVVGQASLPQGLTVFAQASVQTVATLSLGVKSLGTVAREIIVRAANRVINTFSSGRTMKSDNPKRDIE